LRRQTASLAQQWQARSGQNRGGSLGAYTQSDYFKEHKTAHVPPVFWHRLKELEQQTQLPFVRQWAFEWQTLCEQTGTRFTRYPDYFDDVMERRSGIVGQYQQGQAEVLRSAHIRTFALAVSKWNMPQERALDELFDHIPAISGLFDLEPYEKPTWLENFPHDCLDDASDLQAVMRRFISKFRGTDGQVLSFTSPFEIDDARHGHVQLSAFLATDDFELGDTDSLFEPSRFCDTRKNLTIEIEWPDRSIEASFLKGRTGQATPICNGVHPVPHGHWMGHYFSTGIPVVANYCLPGVKSLRVRNGALELMVDGIPASVTSVWHDFWSPHYAQDGGNTRNGVSVEVASSVLNKVLEGRSDGLKLGWLLKTKVWKRVADYGDYELKERQAFVFDDEICLKSI
jgi:hypothetical protein